MAGTITIGSDFSAILKSVRNTVSGAALTTATVTFQLYTAAGVAVAGASGTASYVAASAGTATDAEFAGVIESTTTSTLTASANYYNLYTVSASGVDFTFREDLVAQAPGGVIVDAGIWSAHSGRSLTAGSAEETSAEQWCAAVSAALLRKLRPYLPAPQPVTAYLDAPPRNELILPFRPVRSIVSIHLHSGANSDPAAFVAADLLTPFEDWYSPTDPIDGYNRTGILYRRGVWGWEDRRGIGQLGYGIDPNRGAIKIVAEVGEAFVPADIRAAAVLMVTKGMMGRKFGTQVQSASLNSASYSLPSQALAEGLFGDPTVRSLLASYAPIHVG